MLSTALRLRQLTGNFRWNFWVRLVAYQRLDIVLLLRGQFLFVPGNEKKRLCSVDLPLNKGEQRLVPQNRQHSLFIDELHEVSNHGIDHSIRKGVFLFVRRNLMSAWETNLVNDSFDENAVRATVRQSRNFQECHRADNGRDRTSH